MRFTDALTFIASSLAACHAPDNPSAPWITR
jgi:hypothetical protein